MEKSNVSIGNLNATINGSVDGKNLRAEAEHISNECKRIDRTANMTCYCLGSVHTITRVISTLNLMEIHLIAHDLDSAEINARCLGDHLACNPWLEVMPVRLSDLCKDVSRKHYVDALDKLRDARQELTEALIRMCSTAMTYVNDIECISDGIRARIRRKIECLDKEVEA